MDIIGGLSAAKMALDLAKDLREIDKSVDEAGFKLKLAELTEALADTKLGLVDAQSRIVELEGALKEITEGSMCPVCKLGRLTVDSVEQAFSAGVEIHNCSCNSETCSYVTNKLFDSSLGRYSSQVDK